DVVHVVALDALVNLREEARLLPRQRRAIDRARGVAGMGGLARTIGQHAAGERPAETENRPCGQGNQRAWTARHAKGSPVRGTNEWERRTGKCHSDHHRGSLWSIGISRRAANARPRARRACPRTRSQARSEAAARAAPRSEER